MRVALTTLAVCLALAGGARAQQASLEVPPPILTIDQDRLLQDSRIGSEKLGELEAEAEALAQENAAIEAELVRQEQALTDERPSLDPQVFRDRAEAFDARVKRIRAEQDAKLRELTVKRDAARQAFFAEIADVVKQIVRERGALVVLDRRDVFISADSIDITEEAIRRANETFGEN